MQEKHTISLIVPIYNKEKYLAKCLDSIRDQTCKELEILLVDDGSTDDSLKICQEYARQDGRIRVLPKENGGVASARNLGIQESTGQYLSFADPDDWLHPECMEQLKRTLEETGAEIAYCYGMDILGSTGEIRTKSDETGKVTVIPEDRYDWVSRKSHAVCWGALYRRSVVENVWFDTDLKIGEDTLFLARCIRNAGKIAQLDKAYYYYYINDDSVTSGRYSEGKLTELTAWKRVCEVFREEPFVLRTARAGYALRCREMVVKYCGDEAFRKQASGRVEREFKKNAGVLLRQWLRAGRYDYFLKTVYSCLFWDSWVRKKQSGSADGTER